MRKEKRWRYYCDFCKKSGANSGHIRKHEAYCVRNPSRECRMCKRIGNEQKPLSVLAAAMDFNGLKDLRNTSGGCPVCMLAGIIAWQKRWEEQGASKEELWVDGFDFKAEMKAAWEMLDNAAWEAETERERHQVVAYPSAYDDDWEPF